MYSDIGKGLFDLIRIGFISLCIFVPLDIWKLYDIFYFIFIHLSLGWE